MAGAFSLNRIKVVMEPRQVGLSPIPWIVLALTCVACSQNKAAQCGVAGASVECACPGGTKGAQVCQADGSFGACQCLETSAAKPVSPEQPGQAAQNPPATQGESKAGKLAAPCDPAGNWNITSEPQGSTSCAGAEALSESLSDQWVITKTGAKSWSVGKAKSAPVKIVSVSDQSGTCTVKLSASVDACPSCRPPEETYVYSYVLTLEGDTIAGKLDLSVEPGFDDAERGVKTCTQTFNVTGTKGAIQASQLRFDKQAAQDAFVQLYRDFLNECTFDNHETREVQVRLVVGADGSLKSLKFDGREQDPKANCMDKYLPFIESFFPNTTGKDQVVTFPLTIEQVTR